MNYTPKKIFPVLLNAVLLLIFTGINAFSFPTDTGKTATFKFKTIVIDPGHGGKDPGAHGITSSEKNVALSISKKLRRALTDEMPNVNVVMTRSDDTFIELNRRSEIATEHHGDLFISIHCNSSPEGTGASHRGAELLISALKRSKEQYEAIRENSSIYIEKDYKTKYASYDESNPANRIILNLFLQKYRKQSILFGELVNKEFKNTDNRSSVVKEQSLLVLAHSTMPAVLVETGYINNINEERYLNSDAGQEEIVQSILQAIKAYKKQVSF
jgi:N-acetylmuramoyl-L-alanine amidase